MIPGEIISFITFPGVILHEVSHKFFCDYYNVPVYRVDYFRPFSTIAGCVYHEPAQEFKKNFFIGFGPLIINSIICVVLLVPFWVPQMLSTDFMPHASAFSNFTYKVVAWLGFSIGVNAIPSKKDIELIDTSLEDASFFKSGIVKFLMYFVKFMNIDKVGFWLRIGYTGLISYSFASLCFKVLC